MKNALILIGVVIVAAGIFLYSNKPEPEENLTSGIMGEVRLGPTCPAVRLPPGDDECADKLYQTDMVLVDVNERIVKRFSTDAEGKFRVSVPPGDYAIRKAPSDSPLPSCGKHGLVTVESNKYTKVTVLCDTGIR